MEFMQLAKTRRSVRKYTDAAISEKDINECLEAALLAPSARNTQPWRFVVVTDEALLAPMAEAVTGGVPGANSFAKGCRAFLVVCEAQSTISQELVERFAKRQFAAIDIGGAVEYFCLAAAEKGVGTCIMGMFLEEKIKKLLNIPPSVKIRLVVGMGMPADDMLAPKKRKTFEEAVSYNKF